MKTHRGHIVRKQIDESGMTKTIIAQKLKYKSTKSLYNLYEKPDLDLDVIREIGGIIHFDFSLLIPELAPKQNPVPYDLKSNNHEQDWKIKYYDILEKYNRLLERHNQVLALGTETAINSLVTEINMLTATLNKNKAA